MTHKDAQKFQPRVNLCLKPELLDKLKTEANRSGNSVQCIIKICIAEHYDRLNAGSIA